MSNAPRDAMSSPWCQPEEIKKMISNTDYFKDAKVNNESPTKQEVTKCSVINVTPTYKPLSNELKKSLTQLFINNNIDITNISDESIIILFNKTKIELKVL